MAKYYAKGTLLQVGDGAQPTEVFTTIPHAGDLEGPGGDTSEIDVTDHESPGNTEEVLPTLVSGGTLSGTLFFDPAGTLHQQLTSDQQALTIRTYQLVLTDATNTIVRFKAFVQSFRPATPVRGALSARVALRVTGIVDWNAS